MLVSCGWLQGYFKKRLPKPEKLADVLTFLAFEVEGIEKKGKDTAFNVKILPDRAHYALCHRGIARDLAARLGEEIMLPKRKAPAVEKLQPLSIKIDDKKDCRRYIGRKVQNISVGASSAWLRERLEAIGQRSINNIVDAANYVTLDMGQPLHAFDADKVKGRIVVRRAKKGEAITTLDDKKIELSPDTLIIADDESPLAIAGVKGGVRAAVSDQTKNLILESANFSPTLTRKTSARLELRTDASKRFENEPSSEIASIAMQEFSALIAESRPNARFGEIVDEYPVPQKPRMIIISLEQISQKLGIELGAKEIITVLERFGITVESQKEKITIGIPPERLDLTIPEDIAEEVGRLYGYDKVPMIFPEKTTVKAEISKQFYWEWKIREFLVNEGFSEVMTSSFVSGESKHEIGRLVKIEKPLAEDKSFLRGELWLNFYSSLTVNTHNAPLLENDEIKQFEIGNVFNVEKEHLSLIVGYVMAKKQKGSVGDFFDNLQARFLNHFHVDLSSAADASGIVNTREYNLTKVIEKLSEPEGWDIEIPSLIFSKYAPILRFPFIVRDIALFVAAGTKPEDVNRVIEKESGPLAQRVGMFDQFEKDGRTSFAFRIVFQAHDRTLTDEEANKVMEKVSAALVKKFGAEIR